jgi:hypothetical protein
MKAYKGIDFFIQCLLLLTASISIPFINPEVFDGSWSLFLLAATQIISLIINGVVGLHSWKMVKWRRIHQIGMGIVLLVILIAFIQGSVAGNSGDKDDKYSMDGLGTLIFAAIPAALTAFFYIIITGKEWLNIRFNKREY